MTAGRRKGTAGSSPASVREPVGVGHDGQVSRAELAEVATGLRAVLDLVREGGVTAGSGLVARLEGAVAALDTLAEDTPARDPARGADAAVGSTT